jgi:hypothetical protein
MLLGGVLLAGIFLPVVAMAGLGVVWAMEDRCPKHRARPPRRAVRGPGMPVPYWEGREGPPAFLIAVRPTDGHTVTIDPVAAEWATEWPEPKPWSPWELATGEFPAIIERMGR